MFLFLIRFILKNNVFWLLYVYIAAWLVFVHESLIGMYVSEQRYEAWKILPDEWYRQYNKFCTLNTMYVD